MPADCEICGESGAMDCMGTIAHPECLEIDSVIKFDTIKAAAGDYLLTRRRCTVCLGYHKERVCMLAL